jgi:hypothetical protein
MKSGGFCVRAFGRNLASVTEEMFSHLIYLKRNVILSIRFEKIMMQYYILVFNMKKVHFSQP